MSKTKAEMKTIEQLVDNTYYLMTDVIDNADMVETGTDEYELDGLSEKK